VRVSQHCLCSLHSAASVSPVSTLPYTWGCPLECVCPTPPAWFFSRSVTVDRVPGKPKKDRSPPGDPTLGLVDLYINQLYLIPVRSVVRWGRLRGCFEVPWLSTGLLLCCARDVHAWRTRRAGAVNPLKSIRARARSAAAPLACAVQPAHGAPSPLSCSPA
jgi:hypothetical protein